MNDIFEISEETIAIHSSLEAIYTSDDTAKTSILPPKTRDELIQTIRWIRRRDFAGLFYKYWRMKNGWLSIEEAGMALEIFDDPLAIAMSKAVVHKLFPGSPELVKLGNNRVYLRWF